MNATIWFSDIDLYEFHNKREFDHYIDNGGDLFLRREMYEKKLLSQEQFKATHFETQTAEYHILKGKNTREQLIDKRYKLNTRIRACHLYFTKLLSYYSREQIRIYLPENRTPYHAFLRDRYNKKQLESSFYYDDSHPSGSIIKGRLHQNLINLDYEDSSFDFILCYEILEHIPDYQKALSELYRICRKDGRVLLTFPFTENKEAHTILAEKQGDQIVLHREPEYHGDGDLHGGSILCYRYFGWDILDELRRIGFKRCSVVHMYSAKYAILGANQFILVAQK